MKRLITAVTVVALYGCVIDLEIGVTGTVDGEEIQGIIDANTPVDETTIDVELPTDDETPVDGVIVEDDTPVDDVIIDEGTNDDSEGDPVDSEPVVIEKYQDLQIAWADNSNNEDGFRIDKRLTENADYGSSYWIDANETNYTDTEVPKDEIYCYRVVAYNEVGESSSDEVCTE